MKLLCLSNGHGEDAIALRILRALRQRPNCPDLAALPLVGAGHGFAESGIPVIGPMKQLPSGGFIYMDGKQFARDLRGGLLTLTRQQLKTVRTWARQGGAILAVGDIVPMLFAWYSGAPYAFVGTAKSEYYLRDEAGILPRPTWFDRLENWSGSVYLPWERWLMSRRRCRAVFPRDRLTSDSLRKWNIPVFDVGNPMMDGLEPSGVEFPTGWDSLTVALIPGSRAPEVYDNWQQILHAVAGLVEGVGRKLVFLAAIAPSLDRAELHQVLTTHGWRNPGDGTVYTLQGSLQGATLLLTTAFNDCIHTADVAIAMAGTATEQFVGLGKPALLLPGQGPQFTPAFAEAQTRLLGPSAILVAQPNQTSQVLQHLLNDPDRLQLIAENGHRRMGPPGASDRIARCLMERLGTPG